MEKSAQVRADATHLCDACGGTGRKTWRDKALCFRHRGNGHDWNRTRRAGPDGETYTCACGVSKGWTPCPVCLGARSLPDWMPAADAVADAETLRAVARELNQVECPGATECLCAIATAASVAMYVKNPLYWLTHDYFADMAARAAFRAVPGLRD